MPHPHKDTPPPLTGNRHRAALAITSRARDAADARRLLQQLGLVPTDPA